MKRDIKAFKQKAEEDGLALLNDSILYPRAPGRWDESKAEKTLKTIVDEKKHIGPTPRELWLDPQYPEFREFASDVSRCHIHQETRSRVESTYWLNKKAKTARKKARTRGRSIDDLDFFSSSDN